MENVKEKFINSLMGVLKLDAISVLKIFIEGEVSLLFLLYQENRPLPPSQIAQCLGVSKGRVTALLNSLAEKDYIEISLSTEDRRRFDVSLTESGRLFLEEKKQKAEDCIEVMIESIGNQRTMELIDIISEIVQVMKEWFLWLL